MKLQRIRRSLAVGAAALTVLGAATATAVAAPTTPANATGGIRWTDCPEYSDAVLDHLGFTDHAAFRALWARTECGTLKVPLDHAEPSGRMTTVAFTKLRAKDQARRLGSIAVNPGGPGGGGYLMPYQLTLGDAPTAKLGDRYDLIGFDPRGVGHSMSLDCDDGDGSGPPSFPITEQAARARYDAIVAANKECAAKDPAFLRALTTGNIARDLDRIRRGLGERKMNYLGVSWGSWLGPVYRSLFPGRTGRMWVESVAPTDPRLDRFEAIRSAATAADFKRFAAWVARFDSSFGFGTTQAEVEESIAALRDDFEKNPRNFSDLDMTFGPDIIAVTGAQPSPVWPQAARVAADLRDATDGGPAPQSVKDVTGGDEPEPPPGVPPMGNRTAGHAIFCNGDGGARDFDTWWGAYQERLRSEPVTGMLSSPVSDCAGWPLPIERIKLRHGGGSLVLSGHLYETLSPYQWTPEMRQAVGGRVFTVADDVHGSALRVPECADHIVAFFQTGDPGSKGCQGVPVPDSPGDVAATTDQARPDPTFLTRPPARW